MAITPLPPAPEVSDSPAQFNSKAFAFVDALPTMVTEINAELPAIAAAGDAAEVALGAANFKGEWSSLTGALAIPASVSHNNAVWVLTQSLADVTANEPGVDSPNYWINVALPAPGISGNVLTSNGTNWLSSALPGTPFSNVYGTTATANFTVPADVRKIRAYAIGGGGDGNNGTGSPDRTGGGGGGGIAYGDIAVTPGDTVAISISSKIATVSIGATTYLTANPGSNASTTTKNGGTGGTATKHASVTNGGAYSGGNGGGGNYNGAGGGGGAGSPLGNGGNGGDLISSIAAGVSAGAGGSPISAYGGGAGGGGIGGAADINATVGASPGGGSGGAGGQNLPGIGRGEHNKYTDMLIKNLNGVGGKGNVLSTANVTVNGENAGIGGGGGGAFASGTGGISIAGFGGIYGGGGGAGGAGSAYGGIGGFGGGGGGASGASAYGGNGGIGGGGGGAYKTGATAVSGIGGGAAVIIFY